MGREELNGLLEGKSPSKILARIKDGDPLEIGPRALEALRKRAVLIHTDRAVSRSLARVAYAAVRYEGEPELDQWLSSCIEQSLDELVSEDLVDEVEERFYRYGWLSNRLGCELPMARLVTLAFNALPHETRNDFMTCVMEGTPVEEHASREGRPIAEIEKNVKHAFLSTALAHKNDGVPLDPEDV